MVSEKHKVTYFVVREFLERYTSKHDLLVVERRIEGDYLEVLRRKCYQTTFKKEDIERKLYNYSNSSQRKMFEKELQNLDMTDCERYNKFKERVRN